MGQFLLAGLLITATLGIDTDLTLSYQLFALLLSCYLVASVASSLVVPRISVKRKLPEFATMGERFSYRIVVTNVGRKPVSDLEILDAPRVVTPELEEYLATPEPREEERNAYDRFIGFHRFIWLQRHKTGLSTDSAEVPPVPVGGEVSVPIYSVPLRRGVVYFDSITVHKPDPLGLVYGITRYKQPDKLIVLPKRYPVSSAYRPPGGRHYQPGGINKSRSVGDSEEFMALRDYRAGDMVKRIHWPSFAKQNKPVVKEYQDEYFVRQALVLDNCCADWEILEEIVSVAASFAVTLRGSESLLDLMFLADRVHTFTTGRSLAHEQQMLEILSTIEQSDQHFELLSQSVLQHAAFLSGCIMISSSWDASRKQLVSKLEQLNIPVEVLVITRSVQEDCAGVHFLKLNEVKESLARLTSKTELPR